MSIVTKGLGGKQLLLFGLGETSGEFVSTASADCFQAKQTCEITATQIQQTQWVYGSGTGVGSARTVRKKIFKAKIDAEQKPQIVIADAQIVFTASVMSEQRKQKLKAAGRIIAISDDEIIELLMAA